MTDNQNQPNAKRVDQPTANQALFDMAEATEQWAEAEKAITEDLNQTINEATQDANQP